MNCFKKIVITCVMMLGLATAHGQSVLSHKTPDGVEIHWMCGKGMSGPVRIMIITPQKPLNGPTSPNQGLGEGGVAKPSENSTEGLKMIQTITVICGEPV